MRSIDINSMRGKTSQWIPGATTGLFNPEERMGWVKDRKNWWPLPAWAGYIEFMHYKPEDVFGSDGYFLWCKEMFDEKKWFCKAQYINEDILTTSWRKIKALPTIRPGYNLRNQIRFWFKDQDDVSLFLLTFKGE